VPQPLPVGICWGTLLKATLPGLIREAGANGFGTIAVTPPSYRRAREAGVTARDLRAMLADHGVRVTVIDPLMSQLPGAPALADVPEQYREGFRHDEAYGYEVAEALDAKVLNIAHFLGRKVPLAEMADAVGAISERAAKRGFSVSLEFIPDTGLPDLVTTAEIVRMAGSPNLGVLLDTWHYARSGGTLEQLAALPPGTIKAFQLSDRVAPPPGTSYVPMSGRSFPGEGELPLAEIIRLAVANNSALTAELEIFSAALAAMPPDEAAREVANRTRAWLEGKAKHVRWR
jgi:sugar phosphate isomerase/epimerase